MTPRHALSCFSLIGMAALMLAGGCKPRVDINSPTVILVTADDSSHKTSGGKVFQCYKLKSAGKSCLLLITGEGVSTEFLSPAEIIINGEKTALDMNAVNNTVQVYNPKNKQYKMVEGLTAEVGESLCMGKGQEPINHPALDKTMAL
jgi:hypothetical protein